MRLEREWSGSGVITDYPADGIKGEGEGVPKTDGCVVWKVL